MRFSTSCNAPRLLVRILWRGMRTDSMTPPGGLPGTAVQGPAGRECEQPEHVPSLAGESSVGHLS